MEDKPALEINNSQKIELYKDPSYVSLYRYENPNIPYDDRREVGLVSKRELLGNWYCDNLSDLARYAIRRIEGTKGGKFVVVRIKKDELENYDATKLPETQNMDIEIGNYVIPENKCSNSRVEVEAPFKEEWEGIRNIPFKDRRIIHEFVEEHLSNEAIIDSLIN